MFKYCYRFYQYNFEKTVVYLIRIFLGQLPNGVKWQIRFLRKLSWNLCSTCKVDYVQKTHTNMHLPQKCFTTQIDVLLEKQSICNSKIDPNFPISLVFVKSMILHHPMNHYQLYKPPYAWTLLSFVSNQPNLLIFVIMVCLIPPFALQ